MNLYAKLIVSLGLVSGIAAGLLSFTYQTTAPAIAQRELEEQAKALENVFFLQVEEKGRERVFTLKQKSIGDGVTALYSPDDDEQPVYYAAVGQAVGYNSSVPITLMVGFTGPAAAAADLLDGYVDGDNLPEPGAKGQYVVGFAVVNSEETPGLGEKIKDSRPPYTWLQAATGTRPPLSPDKGTDFQRQFRGRSVDNLSLKKSGGNLDSITASTMTSAGVVGAIKNASSKLQDTLASL